jgi:hypothetical protein
LKKANVEEAIKAYNVAVNADSTDALDIPVGYSSTTGQVTKVNNLKANEVEDGKGNVFGTGYWAVALNGKLVAEDMATVTIEDGDSIVVYWNDTTFGTKLAQVDDSAIAQGIISFYYYDAEGNRQPLKGAKVSLRSDVITNGTTKLVLRDRTKVVDKTAIDADKNYTDAAYEYHFVADEKGQIWIAPEYLDNADKFTVEYAITNEVGKTDTTATVIVAPLDEVDENDGYSAKEVAYYNANRGRNIVDVEVIGYKVEVEADLYNVAGATGDMTVVYALVAFAAVATLAAVVVMKKKSVKAN